MRAPPAGFDHSEGLELQSIVLLALATFRFDFWASLIDLLGLVILLSYDVPFLQPILMPEGGLDLHLLSPCLLANHPLRRYCCSTPQCSVVK